MINFKKMFYNFIAIVIMVNLGISGIGRYDIVNAAENQWITEDFALPVGLRGACVEYADGNMYVIGGDKGLHSPVNTVYIYNFETKTWTTGNPMAQIRGFASSITINGKIYVMGGLKCANSKYSSVNDVEIYDIATDTWSKGESMPFLTTHAKPINYNNKIYVFLGGIVNTGIDTILHKSIQIYDIASNTWSTSSNVPFVRFGYTLNLIDDKVYLIGGYDSSTFSNDVKIFDLKKETWKNGSSMPSYRCYAMSASINNKIYVFGGNNLNHKIYNTTDIYDPVTDTWTNGNNLIIGRRFTQSIIINNKLFIVGGEIEPLETTSKSIESLQLPPIDNRLFAHLYINEKTQLSFSHNLADNNNLTWKSSDTRVAIVDSDGIVTALEDGTTYISAYNPNGSYLDYIPVIVTENDTYRIAVHLTVGQDLKLYMKGIPNDITWFSMDQNIATIDGNGNVTGVGKGLTIVKAKLNGEEHYIYIRVN